MEPDGFYAPFLQPLVSKPNTTLVPKSGMVWANLNGILSPTYLPHQVERAAGSPDAPQRNDTLLVTANVAFYPRKRFHIFDSIAKLILFQMISSIRTSSLFQKYGLVRMLLWVGDDDKKTLVARTCQQRRRAAVEGELATDWITEIAGSDVDDAVGAFVRDHNIDLASAQRVASRMEAAGVSIPAGRESRLVKELRTANPAETDQRRSSFNRHYLQELEELEKAFAAGRFEAKTPQHRRLLDLRYRENRQAKVEGQVLQLIHEKDAIAAAHASGDGGDDLLERERSWNDEITGLVKFRRGQFSLLRDNRHLFYQDPPVTSWDRRELEPLIVQDHEFFPNAPCALLDIQPKAMHPLMRATGRHSNRAGDTFEVLLQALLDSGADPVWEALESVWPGAAEGVVPHCPSLRDPAKGKGGSPVGGCGELSARCLNEAQLIEILEAWMRWPFRPTYSQLLSRASDDTAADMAGEESDDLC